MDTHKLEVGKDQLIEFELIRKDVKNINLTVRPDFSITVSANSKVSLDKIYEFVDSKSSWILKRIGRFSQTKRDNDEKHEFVSGESYKFLGNQYRLELNLTSSIERVLMDEGKLKLYVRNKYKITTKARLMDEWYRGQAKLMFNESLEKMYELIKDHIMFLPTLDFKLMKKRWGSCLRSKHVILLNLELIKAPKYCIDYVVLHELVHFVHKNHDSKFYELLTVLMPDWKQRKEILDQEIVLYV